MTQFKAIVMYYVLRMLFASCRFTVTGGDNLRASSGQPLLLCFWHGDYVPMMPLMSGKRSFIISSQSVRGNTIALLVARFGYQSVLIPDKPSRQSLQRLQAVLEGTLAAGTAVDGPMGPYRKVKGGVTWLASALGMSLVPVALHCQSALRLHSRWDKLLIPMPFSKVTIHVGSPMLVPKSLSVAQRRQYSDMIAEQLQALEHSAKQDMKGGL